MSGEDVARRGDSARAAIEAIEKAMEGVTPGPWYPGHLGTDSTCQCRSIVDDGSYMGAIAAVHVSNGLPVGEGGNDSPPAEEASANMRFIAACNPVAIREVLALARQAESAERAIDDLSHLSVEGFLDWQRDFRRARALLGGENAGN